MRDLTAICRADNHGHFMALADDGTLWLGFLVPTDIDRKHYAMEWQPLNGPPDGDFWSGSKPFWDKVEEKIRQEAEERQRMRDGT